jgi:hypothetical protein
LHADRDRNEFAGRIHDRIPVFLHPVNFGAWLDGSAGPELLKPAGEDPVSKRVNRPGNDEDVSLVDPIEVTSFYPKRSLNGQDGQVGANLLFPEYQFGEPAPPLTLEGVARCDYHPPW